MILLFITWWSQAGSNRRPPACKAGALPSELWPHFCGDTSWLDLEPFTDCKDETRTTLCEDSDVAIRKMVGLGRFELPTSPLSGVRSNQLSYRPVS